MKKLIITLTTLLSLTAFGQQRVIVDSIKVDSIAKIYFKVEKRTVDTTAQMIATAPGLRQEITVREMSLKYLEQSIKAQLPLLDSIKNNQAREYAVNQIVSQDNQYALIRREMDMLIEALKELEKVKK